MKLLNRITSVQFFLCIACLYLIGFFAHALYLGKTVYGDGVYYYAWLMFQPSKFSIGPAMFWAPVYFLTHNQILVGLTGVLATIFALILLFNLLQKQFSNTVSLMTVVAIAGASNLFFYGSLDVVNSHALTFFAVTVFLSLLYTRYKHWFAIGSVLGIVGLMRTQDLLYAVLLIPLLTKKNILLLILGFIFTFWPQLVAWNLVSGMFWVSPYLLHEGFHLLQPQILGVLFGLSSGIFLWTPITLLGVVGLIINKRFVLLSVFLLELYAVASWSTWWQGASYSGRMFVSSLPILSIGVAYVFAWLSKFRFTQAHYLLCIVGPLTVVNVISIFYFLLH